MRRFEGGGGLLGLVATVKRLCASSSCVCCPLLTMYTGGGGIHTALGELEPPRAARCVWAYPRHLFRYLLPAGEIQMGAGVSVCARGTCVCTYVTKTARNRPRNGSTRPL